MQTIYMKCQNHFFCFGKKKNKKQFQYVVFCKFIKHAKRLTPVNIWQDLNGDYSIQCWQKCHFWNLVIIVRKVDWHTNISYIEYPQCVKIKWLEVLAMSDFILGPSYRI